MIGTVTLNPALDKRYIVDKLDVNTVIRTSDYSTTAGGKGINVSRVLRILGANVSAFGFLGGYEGEFIETELKKLGVNSYFIKTRNSTRTCLNIIDTLGENIEILEKGPRIDKEDINKFLEEYQNEIHNFKIITISGSLPLGVDNLIYGDLIEIGNNKNIKTILDTSNNTLLNNLAYSPYIVKPNKTELETIIGYNLQNEEDYYNAGKQILKLGAQNVAISLGSEGMFFIGEKESYKVNIPQISVRNPVGSGDSSVAGFAYGISKDLDIIETLKIANACGMANAMEAETGYINIDNYKKLIEKIDVIKI